MSQPTPNELERILAIEARRRAAISINEQVNTLQAQICYSEGYAAGHADKLLGRTLITARDSHLPGYALGYLAGQGEAIRERAIQIARENPPCTANTPDQNSD